MATPISFPVHVLHSRGRARDGLIKTGSLQGCDSWFGYGFSDKTYPLPKAAALACWGAEHTRRHWVLIPDRIERINLLAEAGEPFHFISLADSYKSGAAAPLPVAAQERKRKLSAFLEENRSGPLSHDLLTISEFFDRSTPLDTGRFFSIEGFLFDLIRRDERFYRDIERLAYTKVRYKLDSGRSNCRTTAEEKNFMRWVVDYALKETAFSVHLAVHHGISIKIGPMSESGYDTLVYSLLSSKYRYSLGELVDFRANEFGSVYLG